MDIAMDDAMDIDPGSTQANKKRAGEDTDRSTEAFRVSAEGTVPRVLRRHHHRRRNIAADTWGLDLECSPADAFPRDGTQKQPFNIYKAILRHNNLFFQFALRLPYSSIMDLYAIDKEFHYRVNKYSVSLIHDYARYHAPLAGHIFTWTLYPQVCISDPMLRPMDKRQWLARDVPGFRWIGMILWRQNIVRSILTMLSLEGHRVPATCEATLMKFWILMEMKTKKLRQSFLQDTNIWSDADIINFQLLLMKLDMRFSNPIVGNGAGHLTSLLLSQRSLNTLWKVLAGKFKMDYETMFDMVVDTYRPEDLDLDENPWLLEAGGGDDPNRPRGLLALESWHEDGAKMPHAVDMVITEGIRRDLHVQKYYIDFMLYGYVDEVTGKNIPLPTQLRGDKQVRVPSEGWPTKKERNQMVRELDDRFGVRRSWKDNAMDIIST